MKRVFVVRHGNTFDHGETVRRVGRGTDLPLSLSGRAQAAALSAHFADIKFDAVICSPLKRTRETADAIVKGSRASVTYDDRLLEIDYGPDEGKPETEVVSRIGQDALQAWDRDAVPPKDWIVDPAAIRTDWADLLSETVGTKLIVTSNGIARFALDLCQHDGAERKLKTGAYGILEERGGGWAVTAWNVRPTSS